MLHQNKWPIAWSVQLVTLPVPINIAVTRVAEYVPPALCQTLIPWGVENINIILRRSFSHYFLFPLFPVVLITDSIEANVETAAVHVEDANVQLDKARNYQVKHSLRKQTCCFVLSRLVVYLFVCCCLFFLGGMGRYLFLSPPPSPRRLEWADVSFWSEA